MGTISYRNRNKGILDSSGKARKPNWEYRFYGAMVKGERLAFAKTGFPTKQAAIEAGSKAYQEYMNGGGVFTESNMSYSDCLDSWLSNYVAIRCNDNTRQQYKKRLDLYIRPELGRYKLTAIKRDSVQTFLNSMYNKHFSRNTLVNMLGLVSSSLRYAKRQGWIQINPADDIDLPATRQCKQLRSLVREPVPKFVLDKIFERFPEGSPAHIPLMLALHCGLRLGEAFGLTWEYVDLAYGVIYVEQQVQWINKISQWQIVPPKYDSKRRVKLDAVMWELLKREKKRQMSSRQQLGQNYQQVFIDSDDFLNNEQRGVPIALVTVRENGTYITPHATAHYNHVIKIELGYPKFDFHSLRHTHATDLCEAGVNIKEIQRRLGHKTMEVTSKRYIHATDLMETQSVDLMNKMYTVEDDAIGDFDNIVYLRR